MKPSFPLGKDLPFRVVGVYPITMSRQPLYTVSLIAQVGYSVKRMDANFLFRFSNPSYDPRKIGFAEMKTTLPETTEEKREDSRVEAFSNLGRRLSAARSSKEAGQIIADIADLLVSWDAYVFSLCSTGQAAIKTLLCIDTIEGQG